MISLYNDARKSPLFHIFIIVALGVALLTLPAYKLLEFCGASEFIAFNLGGAIWRLLIGIVALIFIYKYGFNKVIFNLKGLKNIVFIIPLLLVAINNFPIIGASRGTVIFTHYALDNFIYIVYCLSVGFAEELIFVGLVFPLFTIYFKNKKHSLFLSALLTGVAFSLSHLMNLFGGASVGAVMLQVGYSFLIGAGSAITLAITKNISISILIHFIYDIGGLLLTENGIARGVQWDNFTVTITAILGSITFIYMLFVCIFYKDERLKSLYE